MSLVLSLFPGIGLLDMAFEEEGFCVVRGPDLLWGGDIKRFHPPEGKFDGVIGGPPCQAFSSLSHLGAPAHGDLIPEFERCIRETTPDWFLMENVRQAPIPDGTGYIVADLLLNNRWFGEVQNRVRRFSFGTLDGRTLSVELAALEHPEWTAAVTSAHSGARKTHSSKVTGGKIARYTVAQALQYQGLPPDFFGEERHSGKRSPLTQEGRLRMIANGVPLPMGRAVARAVKEAIGMLALALFLSLPALADLPVVPTPRPTARPTTAIPATPTPGAAPTWTPTFTPSAGTSTPTPTPIPTPSPTSVYGTPWPTATPTPLPAAGSPVYKLIYTCHARQNPPNPSCTMNDWTLTLTLTGDANVQLQIVPQ